MGAARPYTPLSIRLHLILLYNRVRIIAENLREALAQAGVEIDVKPPEDEFRQDAGSLAISMLEEVQTLAHILKDSSNPSAHLELKCLVPILLRYAENLELAAAVLSLYSKILGRTENVNLKALAFTLRTVIHDLNVIRRRNYQFARLVGSGRASLLLGAD